MSTLNCFCDCSFKTWQEKGHHIKKCQVYKDKTLEYLNPVKLKEVILNNRYNITELIKIYPYNVFIEKDIRSITMKLKLEKYYRTLDGSKLTCSEINNILNHDILYNLYVIQKKSANDYKLLTVWESDFQNDPQKVINECCEFIKQNINN